MADWIPLFDTGGFKLRYPDIVCVDKSGNRIHSTNYRTFPATFASHNYTTGALVAETSYASVLVLSGHDSVSDRASCIGADGYYYVVTYNSADEAGTAKIAKIDPTLRLEVDNVRAALFDAPLWGGDTFSFILYQFTLSGVQYLAFVMDDPEGTTPGVEIINAATMTSVTTGTAPFPEIAYQISMTRTNVEGEFYLVGWDYDFNIVNIYKLIYTIAGGISFTLFKSLDGFEFFDDSEGMRDTGAVLCEPTGDLLIYVYVYTVSTGSSACLARMDKDDASTVWTMSGWYPEWWGGMVLAQSDLSGGTLMHLDYIGGWFEVDLATGAPLGDWIRDPHHAGSDAAHYWDSVNHRSVHYGSGQVREEYRTWAITNYQEIEKPWIELLRGGFCRDACLSPLTLNYEYEWRETHFYDGYEMVRIDTRTGDVLQGQVFSYDDNYAWDDLIDGMPGGIDSFLGLNCSGDGLLLFLHSGSNDSGTYYERIQVFDVETMTLQDVMTGYTNVFSGGVSGVAWGGLCASYTGRFIAATGDYKSSGNPAVVISSYVTLWDRDYPDTFSRITMTSLGINGILYNGMFDADGFMWALEDRLDGINGFQHWLTTMLHKFSVTGGATPSLTLVDSFEIDDMYYYPPTSVAGFVNYGVGFGYNPSTNKFLFWSSYTDTSLSGFDTTEGWHFTFDLATETFSEHVNYPQGSRYNWGFPNYGGWTLSRYFPIYATHPSHAGRSFWIFDSETLTSETFITADVWDYSSELTSWIIVYNPESRTFLLTGVQFDYSGDNGYLDTLWFIEETVIEPCPPCEVDTTPCGETIEPPCTVEWPFALLQPRSVGIIMIPATIGGGPAMFGGHEEAKATSNGFWRFSYGDIPVHDRAQILALHELEVALEGSGVICLHAYEGKRAPWLTVGGAIIASAAGAFTVGSTNGNIRVTTGGVLRPGMFWSNADRLYCLKTVGLAAGSPPIYPVTIFPHIRADIADGALLEFARPMCRARLAEDGELALPLNLLEHNSLSLDFEEDV